ncbi:hypothetical protein K6989_00735 [Mycoplasmopsis synoviae]|uniref:trigger factor-related chaperone n=1 Tax=Mycoplasmopsis synoviae TaxID=2109 RepID=UPI001CE0B9EF|nr:hypothetical protein [Mycoplasmopsis synoviae]UBX97544.1 hypothetical protein K6989_00735 [Mycoplasmopsis synoviae]
MKFFSETVKLEKNKWLEAQRDSLAALEEIKKKQPSLTINQSEILDFAFMNLSLQMADEHWKQKLDSNPNFVVYKPLLQNHKKTVDSLEVEYKTYYLDDLEKFSFDDSYKSELKLESNYEELLQDYIEKFIQNYEFHLPKKDAPVAAGDYCKVVFYEKEEQKASERPVFVYAGKSKDQLAFEILSLELNKPKAIDFYGLKGYVEVLEAFEVKHMPITEENVKLLNLPFAQTLADLKNAVYKQVRENIVANCLYYYGNDALNFYTLNDKDIAKIEFEKDLEAATNQMDQSKNPNFANYTLKKFSVEVMLRQKWNIDVTEEELHAELQIVNSFINLPKNSSVNWPRLYHVVFCKKLGLRLLKKNFPEVYNEHKEFVRVS